MNRARKLQSPSGQKMARWGLVAALALLLALSNAEGLALSPAEGLVLGAGGGQEAEVQERGIAGETGRGGDREMGRQGEGESVPLSQEHLRPFGQTTARTVIYTYDDAGRLVQADYGSKRVIYTYDAAGNLLSREIEIRMGVYLPLVLRQYGP